MRDKLFVILQNNQYRFDKIFDEAGFSLYKEVGFNDNQKAHKEFWDKHERPPLEEYWDYIINRRDLLVPQDIRERKGSFLPRSSGLNYRSNILPMFSERTGRMSIIFGTAPPVQETCWQV